MAEEVLKFLANRTNQGILSLLRVEPTYPRKVADLLSLSETEVSRRLKQMEGMGLVEGEWAYIGKNVKLYKLLTDKVHLQITPEGLQLELSSTDGPAARTALVNPITNPLPEPEAFVGRRGELEELRGEETVCVIEGMPGIGKTSLVAQYARDVRSQRPVFWHSFRGVESLNWLANRLAVFRAQNGDRALLEATEAHLEPADLREAVLRGLDDEAFVIILDDVHTLQDEEVSTLISDAIARVRQGKLVVSGRERPRYDPTLGHVKLLHLGGLDDEAVGAFLEQKGIDLDADLLPLVRQEVGGHPLALNLFLEAARDLGVEPRELLDRIPESNLEDYLLQEIYGALSENERRVLSIASVFRTSFAIDDLRVLSTKNPEGALFKLRKRLLLQGLEGEYQLHEVLRNFFYNLLEDEHKRTLHAKAAKHYLGTGTLEGRLEAMHHLLAADKRDRVLRLLEQDLDLQEFDFIDAGYQNLYLSILELFTQAEVGDDRRWALIEDEKGDILYHRSEPKAALAHYEAAVALFDAEGDAERLADLAWKRALCHQRLGNDKTARKLIEEGLEVAPEGGIERERLEELKTQLP